MNHSDNSDASLIQLENLAVTFLTSRGAFRAVRSASLEIARGEVLGLVGESGCGKSTVAFAMMNYLPGTAQVEGAVRFEGMDIAEFSDAELRELRGNRVAMVYQDPLTSLNPSMRNRHTDRRSPQATPGHGLRDRPAPFCRPLRQRRPRGPGTHRQALSPRAERWPAAACSYRDGSCLRPHTC